MMTLGTRRTVASTRYVTGNIGNSRGRKLLQIIYSDGSFSYEHWWEQYLRGAVLGHNGEIPTAPDPSDDRSGALAIYVATQIRDLRAQLLDTGFLVSDLPTWVDGSGCGLRAYCEVTEALMRLGYDTGNSPQTFYIFRMKH